MIDVALLIKSRVTLKDVILHYGFKINSKGFMCCPFHKEKTASMKIYEGDKGYYCFGCGEHGDVITFIQKLFNISFTAALKKLDCDFNLCLMEKPSLADYRKSQQQFYELKTKQENEKQEREQLKTEYEQAYDEWAKCDIAMIDNSPCRDNDEWSSLFAAAVHKITYHEYLLNIAEMRKNQHDRRTDSINANI